MSDGTLSLPFGMNYSDMISMFSSFGILQSGIAGFGQYEAGQMQKKAYEYNAAVALNKMREEEATTEQKYSALTGRQASLYARAGVDIASGSPLMIMAATAGRGGIETERIHQAGMEEYALDQYYAKSAAWSGMMGGVSTFLKGLTSAGMGALSANASNVGGNIAGMIS